MSLVPSGWLLAQLNMNKQKDLGYRRCEFESGEISIKSRWVTHKGRKNFIADYSEHDTNLDAVLFEAAAVIEAISQEPPNSVLALTDISYTYAVDAQSLNILLKNAFPKVNPYV